MLLNGCWENKLKYWKYRINIIILILKSHFNALKFEDEILECNKIRKLKLWETEILTNYVILSK